MMLGRRGIDVMKLFRIVGISLCIVSANAIADAVAAPGEQMGRVMKAQATRSHQRIDALEKHEAKLQSQYLDKLRAHNDSLDRKRRAEAKLSEDSHWWEEVAYAVKNPTTFITGGSGTDYDWVYSSRDNTLWQTSKTIYDPCPPGWKVPAGGDSGVWSKALGSSDSFDYTWNSTSKGMNFSGKFGSASTIWYPAAGYLEYDDGCLYNVGYFGFWWSCQ